MSAIRDDSSLPRVLFAAEIDPSHKFGTFEEQTLWLARAFHERGGLFLPVYPMSLGPKATEEYRALGLRAETLNLGRFQVPTLARLAALVRSERIDVVHWNFYESVKNGYLWGLSALTPTVRHYLTDHNSRVAATSESGGSRIKRTAKSLVFRRYEKILGVSNFISENLRISGAGRQVGRWTHLVNTDRFAPEETVRREVRDRLGVGNRFVALLVGQLIAEKGVDVAIRAARELSEGAELWIVGGGVDESSLKALADDLAISDRVRFLGIQWDVAPFMKAADCLVCPSVWAEAAGLVNIEALACGLPVVASRIGGIPEIVDDGLTGILFPPGDFLKLAEALRSLQANPSSLRTMADSARAAALERYALKSRIGDYLDYYRVRINDR